MPLTTKVKSRLRLPLQRVVMLRSEAGGARLKDSRRVLLLCITRLPMRVGAL